MRFFFHHLPDVVVGGLGICALLFVVRQLRPKRWLSAIVLAFGCGLMLAGIALRAQRVFNVLPLSVAHAIGTISFLVLLLSLGCAVTTAIWSVIPRPKPQHSAERRQFLMATRAAVLASPVVATGYGVFIQRDNFRVREVTVPIVGLATELDGLRLVQLTDMHVSPFLSLRELARTVDMANELKPHVALVTGDIISSYRDPLEESIRELARLKAEGGILGCLGNHEIYARCENHATELAARRGIRILRNQAEQMNFRGKPINFAGVDYQPMRSEYLVGAGEHIRLGMPNILLSHNPDVFKKAAAQGYDLTIAGHTHGGQITVEILHQNFSVARFYTPYVYGLYREGDASIYVSRGIGTVGVPARLGAPPEVASIRLCAI